MGAFIDHEEDNSWGILRLPLPNPEELPPRTQEEIPWLTPRYLLIEDLEDEESGNLVEQRVLQVYTDQKDVKERLELDKLVPTQNLYIRMDEHARLLMEAKRNWREVVRVLEEQGAVQPGSSKLFESSDPFQKIRSEIESEGK